MPKNTEMRNFKLTSTQTLPLPDAASGSPTPVAPPRIRLGGDARRGVRRGGAVPSLFIREGQPFSHRDLILYITSVVILVTLVFQGVTLPWLMRVARLEDNSAIPEHRQESSSR